MRLVDAEGKPVLDALPTIGMSIAVLANERESVTKNN